MEPTVSLRSLSRSWWRFRVHGRRPTRPRYLMQPHARARDRGAGAGASRACAVDRRGDRGRQVRLRQGARQSCARLRAAATSQGGHLRRAGSNPGQLDSAVIRSRDRSPRHQVTCRGARAQRLAQQDGAAGGQGGAWLAGGQAAQRDLLEIRAQLLCSATTPTERACACQRARCPSLLYCLR